MAATASGARLGAICGLRCSLRRARDGRIGVGPEIGGGVSANHGLRVALQKLPLPVFVPPLKYCTDNAAMSGGLAHVLLQQGQFSDLALDALTQSEITLASS